MNSFIRFVIVLAILGLIFAKKSKKTDGAKRSSKVTVNFCPSLQCAEEFNTEQERWDCIGKQLFEPIPEGKSVLDYYYIEHDCGGVGWGNSVRGLFNAASMAALTGRRLIVTHAPFNRLFLSPYGEESQPWDFGLSKVRPNKFDRGSWDYEAFGRSKEKFISWAAQIRDKPETLNMPDRVMLAAVCGGDRSIMVEGECLSKSMPSFVGCARASHSPTTYLPDNVLSAPFFYMMFKRPAPRLVELLNMVRQRLELPQLTREQEPIPGSRGLYTPGYYLFALHVRHIPVGFEPLAIDLNHPKNLKNRLSLQEGYWKIAVANAKKAARIAKCRKEKLLIYFATDDALNMRRIAQEKLGHIGKLVFGLTTEEVGHMSPQWTQNDERVLERIMKTGTLSGEKSYADETHHRTQDTAANEVIQRTADMTFAERRKHHGEEWNLAESKRHQDAVNLHGDMAMVEWFILGHAHWLQGHSGSSYAESAAGLGLSPLGVMERFDMVHGHNHASKSWRPDYNIKKDFCTHVGAADPTQATTCPNTADDNNDEDSDAGPAGGEM